MPTATRIVRKSPAEAKTIGLQFTAPLDRSETLTAVTVIVYRIGTVTRQGDVEVQTPTVTNELTAIPASIGGSGIHDDKQVNALIAGGVSGGRYQVEMRATTSAGEVCSGFLTVDVR